jgi:hypothetical protein
MEGSEQESEHEHLNGDHLHGGGRGVIPEDDDEEEEEEEEDADDLHLRGLNDEDNDEENKSEEEDSTLVAGDDDGIAFAAHAAAQAISESDAAVSEHPQQVACRICGRGDEDGRPVLRFLPVEHDLAAATASPSVISFTQDIGLHIFCGKTASILPTVNQPELEILTKAGLKNKHGIGPEVNAALARTRCAILAQEGAKEKHFYLVREFEAHLAAIRHTRITYIPGTLQRTLQDALQNEFAQPTLYDATHTPATADHQPSLSASDMDKLLPVRAAAGQIRKAGQRYISVDAHLPTNAQLTEDGKIRCGCGGTHLPTGTPRGVQSWRSHVLTKRHQKWMEDTADDNGEC